MPTVLFVCMANRSRSPIAAACFGRELAGRGWAHAWRVSSAGTWAVDGLPPVAEAFASAERLGLDLTGHLSKAISANSIEGADVILVMEGGQKEALENEFSGARKKTHLLSEVGAGSSYDVPDPVSPAAAAEIHAEIAALVYAGFDRICALATKR